MSTVAPGPAENAGGSDGADRFDRVGETRGRGAVVRWGARRSTGGSQGLERGAPATGQGESIPECGGAPCLVPVRAARGYALTMVARTKADLAAHLESWSGGYIGIVSALKEPRPFRCRDTGAPDCHPFVNKLCLVERPGRQR